MSGPGAKELIETGASRFVEEVPALKQLKLVARIELRAKGDIQSWRLDMPDISASKDIPEHALVELEVMRPVFNELALKGSLKDWIEAYEHGDVKVGGQGAIIKLVGNVIERHVARTRLKKIK